MQRSFISFCYDLRGSAYCRRPRIFGFFGKCRFWIFLLGLGSGGGLQSIGNGCGLQLDGFSIQTEPYYGSIFKDVHDFYHFGIVFGGLMLSPEGPKTLQECPEGPGTL